MAESVRFSNKRGERLSHISPSKPSARTSGKALTSPRVSPMGNKAAGGPFQLEVPSGEAPRFQVGAMNGNTHGEGCATADLPPNGAGEASDGSGDDERAYASPAEVEEGLTAEAGSAVAAPAAPTMDEHPEDTINFTRNNSQSSISNNRLPGSPDAAVIAPSEGASPLPERAAIPTPTTVDSRLVGRVSSPPPPPAVSAVASTSARPSVSPPRVPGGADLQLPPLNDPNPVPSSEEVARLSSRGSPINADGRDQKGAQ